VGRAHLRDRGLRLATDVFLREDRAVACGLDAHPFGQCVHDAHPDAVEAARDLVAAAAELAAGVEDRVHDLEGVLAGRMLPDGDATAVVHHDDRSVLPDRDLDLRRMAGHRLVDRVVDHLPYEVVETPKIGRADVHARPASDRLEPFEDLDARRGVVGPRGRLAASRAVASGPGSRLGRFLGHAGPPIRRS